MSERGLIIGLGNPVLTDDGVGLYVTDKLRALYEERELSNSGGDCSWQFMEFDGCPLDLVSHLDDIDRLLIIDAWYPHDGGPVSVLRVDRAAQCAQEQIMATDTHGVNVGETLTLAWELGITDLSEVWLFLIPVDDPFSLSESLTPQVEDTAQAVVEYIWTTRLQPQTAGSSTVEASG